MMSSYHHQSNRQGEACIKFVNCTIKNALTLIDIYLALSHIHSVLIGAGLLSLPVMLFNRPIRGLLPQLSRDTINVGKDDILKKALETQQKKNEKGRDAQKEPILLQDLH